jgi:hypothetical protein
MDFTIDYPHPVIGVPPGKRSLYVFHQRGEVGIEVPEFFSGEIETVVTYRESGHERCVVRQDGAFYVDSMSSGRIASRDAALFVQHRVIRAISDFAEQAIPDDVNALFPGRSLWTSIDMTQLPEPGAIPLKNGDKEFDEKVLAIVDRVRTDFILVDGQIFQRCSEPRFEFCFVNAADGLLRINHYALPDPAKVRAYDHRASQPIAYFPIDQELEARAFAGSALHSDPDNVRTRFQGGTAFSGTGPLSDFARLTMETTLVRAEETIRAELAGSESSPVFASALLDTLSVEAIGLYRGIRQVSVMLKGREAVDTDYLVELLSDLANSPARRQLMGGGDLPLEEVLERWSNRPVDLAAVASPAFVR